MAPRTQLPTFDTPQCGVSVRVSDDDLQVLLQDLGFATRLVGAMHAEGEAYKKVQAIDLHGNDVLFVTADALDSHELLGAMNKKVPPSLKFDEAAQFRGLIQEEYMLDISKYEIPAGGSKKDATDAAKTQLERHFRLKKGQITDYKFVGSKTVRITTCDLNVLNLFRVATDDFTRPVTIDHRGKP